MGLTPKFMGGGGGLSLSGGSLSGALTIGNGTLTASAPLLVLSQTWNNAGVTFNALTLDVTNTASGALSNLALLRVGGTNQFRVDKDGNAYARTSFGIGEGVNTSIQEGYIYSINRIHAGSNVGLQSTNWGANTGLAMSNAASNGVRWSSSSSLDATAAFSITRGTVTPEGNETAGEGSIYLRNNAGTGELWMKLSGTGNTGWTQVL